MTTHSESRPRFWAYVVTTKTKSYYFPEGSTISVSSDGQLLIARGYLSTFTWLLSDIVRVLNYGTPVNLSNLMSSQVSAGVGPTKISIEAGGNACEVNRQLRSSCPDCVGAPDNPDNCQYSEDPFHGGCLGADGTYICANVSPLDTVIFSECTRLDIDATPYGGSESQTLTQLFDYYLKPTAEGLPMGALVNPGAP